ARWHRRFLIQPLVVNPSYDRSSVLFETRRRPALVPQWRDRPVGVLHGAGGRFHRKRRAEKRERIPPFSKAYSLACRTIAVLGFRVDRSSSRSTCSTVAQTYWRRKF